MAIEQKRGCGYRKVGGLYMVGGGIGVPCDRLPFELTVCSCCGQGIKQARGFTWIDVAKFFRGPHLTNSVHVFNETVTGPAQVPCNCGHNIRIGSGKAHIPCELCHEPEKLGRAGLVWVGEKFYKTPEAFLREGVEMGISRRIKAIPQGFKIGETYVMLAHPKAISTPLADVADNGEPEYKPGIFYAWLPQRFERIYLESQKSSEEVQNDEKRGILPVFVPDEDVDHKGNVHDDFEREKREAKEDE